MSGLCGWLAPSTGCAPDGAESMLASMRDELPPAGASAGGIAAPQSALGTRAHEATAFAAHAHDTWAAIDGTPHWRDRELAALAASQGHAAALLEGHRRHGVGVLERLGGGFALAIVMPQQQALVLAIDRLGQRPLCFARTPAGGVVFASSVQSVGAHCDLSTRLNPQALYDYVYFHMVPSPETIYTEVNKLAPAECLELREGHLELKRYWEPDFEASAAGIETLSEELRTALRAAVANCGPGAGTGSFLSGGLDSSTVTGILAETVASPPPAFSIGFAADGYDEMDYARAATERFGNPLHAYYITPDDVADAIPRIAAAYDEPFGNSSAIPTYICARRAREQGIDTLLAGDGGDELFGGNERYAKQKIFEAYHAIPPGVRRALIEPAAMHRSMRLTPVTRKLQSYVQQARIPMPERTQTYNYLHRRSPAEVFTPQFMEQVDQHHPAAMLSERYHQAPCDTLLGRMLYLDWKFTLADNDLRKVGRSCEVAGVTVRYPFLDDELVALANRIPSRLKLKGQHLRYFFKYASRGFLPEKIINKPKHGFGLPFGEWLKTSQELQSGVYANLTRLKSRELVQGAFIDELIAQHRTGHAAFYGTFVWVLAMLEEWLGAHSESL